MHLLRANEHTTQRRSQTKLLALFPPGINDSNYEMLVPSTLERELMEIDWLTVQLRESSRWQFA
jgi:hypothetical protein